MEYLRDLGADYRLINDSGARDPSSPETLNQSSRQPIILIGIRVFDLFSQYLFVRVLSWQIISCFPSLKFTPERSASHIRKTGSLIYFPLFLQRKKPEPRGSARLDLWPRISTCGKLIKWEFVCSRFMKGNNSGCTTFESS